MVEPSEHNDNGVLLLDKKVLHEQPQNLIKIFILQHLYLLLWKKKAYSNVYHIHTVHTNCH